MAGEICSSDKTTLQMSRKGNEGAGVVVWRGTVGGGRVGEGRIDKWRGLT